MAILQLVARLGLTGVFMLAGVAKLADREGSAEALGGFGVPGRLARPVGILLPVLELAVAVCLLVSALAWWGAVGALGLLVLFCVGMVVALARGSQPDCHCFGQLHSARVSWGTLARNVLLAGIAGFVAVAGWHHVGLSATHWVTSVSGVGAALIAAVLVVVGAAAFLGWFCLQILHQNGRILQRLDALEASVAGGRSGPAPALVAGNGRTEDPRTGLAVFSRAPLFTLPDLDGEPVALGDLAAAGKPVLLVFSDPGCGPCVALLPELARWQQQHRGHVLLALISRGSIEQNRAKTAAHRLEHVLLQHDREVAEAYHCHGTPGAVIVAADLTIASGLAQGAEQIRALVAATADPLQVVNVGAGGNRNGNGSGNANRNGNGSGNGNALVEDAAYPLLGKPVPQFTLPDLDGNPIDLSSRRGQEMLLLFWNPGCGFCQRMVSDLVAWQADPPAGAPELLVIASGGPEENRAVGLTSPVVLDTDGAAMRAFAARGTPMGVLIDREGQIASQLAIGAHAVFELAGSRSAERVNGAGDG